MRTGTDSPDRKDGGVFFSRALHVLSYLMARGQWFRWVHSLPCCLTLLMPSMLKMYSDGL